MARLLRFCALVIMLLAILVTPGIATFVTKPSQVLAVAGPNPAIDPYELRPDQAYLFPPSAPTEVLATLDGNTISVSWNQRWLGRGKFEGFAVTRIPIASLYDLTLTSTHIVTFTNLVPGVYSFTVTALGQFADSTSVPTNRIVVHTDISLLADKLASAAKNSGGTVAISFTELYSGGHSWSQNSSRLFIAASTYKLPILMFEAQNIAEGKINPNGNICYNPSDYEPGLGDVAWGGCYTRNFLAYRVAHYSNNTAAHMLIGDLGGGNGLNNYARAHGATNPQLYYPNFIDSHDLAALWQNEYEGKAGGEGAQDWLYPLLTHTDPSHEQGIPAGVPSSAVVVHKIGNYASGNNDAALILNGPSGAYVLVVLTDGLSSGNANALMRTISADVWAYESA